MIPHGTKCIASVEGLERERGMAEYGGCFIEPLGRVYTDVQVVDLE
jgi:hypothetical protein